MQSLLKLTSQKKLIVFLFLIFALLLAIFYVFQLQNKKEWQPDGEWIVFSCIVDVGNDRIYRIRSDGTQLEEIITERQNGKLPIWSPNGEWIVFSKVDVLSIMRPDGSEINPLSPRSVPGYPMAWTSDNQWIIYTRHGSIYKIRTFA